MVKERTVKIFVSARILRHISRGIYRTPAGALKELIVNSYDAGALRVTINTGYPDFKKMVITDDGAGMSCEDFENIVQSIGLSNKTAGDFVELPESNLRRTIVGHYGIGMLAIGQLCGTAKITSKKKGSKDGFEAIIDFDQFDIKPQDGIPRAAIKDEKQLESAERPRKATNPPKTKKIEIGTCKLRKLDYNDIDKPSHFTRIELENIRSSISLKLSGDFYRAYGDTVLNQKYYPTFDRLLELFVEFENQIRRGQYPYEKLCWELATYCPLSYPDLDAFKAEGPLQAIKMLADQYDFQIVIDGLELHKPLLRSFFSDNSNEIRRIFGWKNEPYASGKQVSGYLICRRKIRPKCMQGILVRVGGVAVGMYDLTYLEYPYHEAVKFEQLTGELFVDGLFGAMNVDRNSFNETDDDYLALVQWFHGKLHNQVFPEIKKMMERKREDASSALVAMLSDYFKNHQMSTEIRYEHLGKKSRLFHLKGKTVIINKDHNLGRPRKSRLESYCLAIILIASGSMPTVQIEDAFVSLVSARRTK